VQVDSRILAYPKPRVRRTFWPVVCVALACATGEARGDALVATRVVSLSPAATEVLIGIDAIDALIAVDAESHRIDGMGAFRIVDLGGSVELLPDVVVLPRWAEGDAMYVEALRAGGTRVIEFDPHDFDEAFELCLVLGERLGRRDAAHRFVRARSRSLAVLSHASIGRRRPRVAAVVGTAPIRLSGGHSFVTDLIQVAGAESVTHGGDEWERTITDADWPRLAPELVLVATRRGASVDEREAIASSVPPNVRLEYMPVDTQTIWLTGALEWASRLREHLAPLVEPPTPALD